MYSPSTCRTLSSASGATVNTTRSAWSATVWAGRWRSFTPRARLWVRATSSSLVLEIDRIVETFGNVPALLIEAVFTLLRPTAKIRAALRFFEHCDEPQAHEAYAALARWSDDWIPFPGLAARQWITAFYQENRLIRGELEVAGVPIDLGRITAPVLAIAAEHDEISPPPSIEPLIERVSSRDRTFVVLPGGHIGLVAGRSARRVLWPILDGWLAEHSVPV